MSARPASWVLLIISIAAWWRLADLGQWSLDGDEIYSWMDVQRLLAGGDWPHGIRTQPLGYLAMAGVVGLAGLDELTLRLAPALGGLVTVALLLLMRRDVLSTTTALVAGGLAAISPWLIFLSQEARFYGVLMPLATLATLWALPGPGRRPLAALVAWSGAVACHPTAAMLGVGMLLPVLRPPIPWRGLMAFVGLAMSLLGWLLLLDGGALFMVVQRVLGRIDPGHYDALHFVLGLGYNFGPMVGLLALVGAWVSLRDRDARSTTLLAFVIVPIVVLLGLALSGISVHQRYALAAVPAALVLAGDGLGRILRERRRVALALVALALAFHAPALLGHSRDGNRHDIRGVAAWLAQEASSEDVLVADEHVTVELYLHRHEGYEDSNVAEDTELDARRRHGFLRTKQDCWVALKIGRLNGTYDSELLSWLDDHFDEVARIGREPPPLVQHDNRYVIFKRRQRLPAAAFQPEAIKVNQQPSSSLGELDARQRNEVK